MKLETNPLHIIQISSYYPPHLGGQENAVHDLAGQLARAGHEVHVLTSAKGTRAPGVATEGQVHVQRLPAVVFGHAPIMPRFLRALLRTAQPSSVVHLHVGQAFTPEMVWLASRLRPFKYIAELHIDFEPSGPGGVLLPLYKRLILKRVLQSAAAVIVLNEKTLRTVRQTYGYKGKASILNNGIEEAYFTLKRPKLPAKSPKTMRLLFVGRFSKQKNVPVLLKALALTSRKVHLDIIGDGDEGELIEKTIGQYSLSEKVTLHGRLGREQVRSFYKSCDALVMPSLYEAQPLVLLEAMAARIPIIGTNVIGVAEHLKDAGIIVEPTPQGIAQGIETYYSQYALLPQMIARGYELAQAFRWHNTLKRYESFYEEVMAT